jgi:hypothetical protein
MPTNFRVRRLISIVMVALLATLCVAPRVYADAAPKWTDAQLVSFSDLIVQGRVTGIKVAQDASVGSLYTYVSLDVASVLKGSIPGDRIVLKQLGGRLGATALQIAGQPAFSVGEEVLVFLEVRPRDRTLTVTAQWQGKFTIAAASGAPQSAVRDDPGGAARGIFSGQTRALASWLPELRQEIGASAAEATAPIEIAPAVAALASVPSSRTSTSAAVWRDAALAGQPVRVDAATLGQPGLPDGGERILRAAADYWTKTGIAALATGGLQPSGCFTTRAPNGRIAVGVDGCDELSPRGGTIALSGGWIQYETNASGVELPRFLSAGVMTNRGQTASRLLSQPACFEQLLKHELGHALGLVDSPDGAGVMGSSLQCDGFGNGSGGGASDDATRPTFVPLDPGVSATVSSGANGIVTGARDTAYDSVACVVGCDVRAATAITGPNVPTNLSASLSGSTLTLTWTAPAGDAPPTSYTIEVGSTPGASDVANIATGSPATSFSAAVGGNAVFYIRVRATNEAGTGGPSNEIVVSIGNATPPPGAPGGLTATVAGSTVTLTWTAPTTGGPPSNYIVEAGSNSGFRDLANFSTGSTTLAYSVSGVPAGTYYVRVRASNSGGTSPSSNEIVIIVGGGCAAPGAPSNLAAAVSGSTVVLTWSAGAEATSYQLQVGSSSGRTDILDTALQSSATSFSAVNVPAGTYFVRLRSNSICGQSASSNEIVVIIR